MDGFCYFATLPIKTLLVGGQSISASTLYTPGNTTRLSVMVDATNIISERDEADNHLALNAFGPDLEITAAAVDYWGGGEIDLLTSIRNTGTSPSPVTTLTFYREDLTGTLLVTSTVPSLTIGKVITMTIPWNFGPLEAEDYPLLAVVNQAGFTEVFTTNNTYTFTLEVRPDLMVSPYYMWTTELPKETVAFTTTLYNVGAATADNITVAFYGGETLAATDLLFTRTVSSLAPTGSVQLAGQVAGPLEVVYVLVDPDWAILETTRANNLAVITATGEGSENIYIPLILK